ncbi:tetraacyldisaccharide 4'-kinase [Gammaproteobacteria bacterium]|nr:tetraacyldisaccharide 4'-kinase [Gammaproteobacteria bacterium]
MTSGVVAGAIRQAWYGRSLLGSLLQPLAWLFGLAVRLRRSAYRRGWLASGHPGVPVIVVGNLTAGGAGKTPLVAWLVQRLRETGRHPGIVSRGYGGVPQPEPLLVDAATDPAIAGDEPVLLARRTGAPVVVCVDRLRAAQAAARSGADVIVADDGLQHYALRRDVEIVVVDGVQRWGNGRLLPAGPLREPLSRLAEVDMLVVNGGEPGATETGFRLFPGTAVSLATGERRALEHFAGRRVLAVAGIGNPARFHALLASLDMQVMTAAVPDHGRADLALLRSEVPWPILMTEKDAVKYPHWTDPDTWYLPVELQMAPGSEDRLMSCIASRLQAAGAAHG